MTEKLRVFYGDRAPILPQPDNFTCGPTCLHSVFSFYGDDISLPEVIRLTPSVPGGGTLAVMLGNVALERGYRARIYSYNLELFDPTWFTKGMDLAERLRLQAPVKANNRRLQTATTHYLEFLRRGGQVRFAELTSGLLSKYLRRGQPILTGLSSTYLYQEARELPSTEFDDIVGEPTGHFVILAGYDPVHRTVIVADPLHPNPMSSGQLYEVPIARVVGAIFLGVLTYDANMLLLDPPATSPARK